VFVEKPLAVTREQLHEISQTYKSNSDGKLALMTGFNRRFSRPFQDIRDFFSTVSTPLVVMYRVNAGELPANHWLYEPGQGGRILGEACHFIDCMAFLTNASPIRVFAEAPAAATTLAGAKDSVSVTIRFSNGSVGNLLYLSSGEPSMGKEFCEVSGGGGTAVMNNFQDVVLWRSGKRKRITYGGDKGHAEEVKHFIAVTTGTQQPVLSVQSILETSSATLAIGESLLRGMPIDL
jgi:polar amino acid transport system substrate-binding protein